MTASDWFVLAFVAPLMITAGWVVCLQVWRAGRDVSQAVGWFTGERWPAGYHAFLGPGFLAMTAGWVGTVLTEIDQAMKVSHAWLGPTVGICFAVCLGCLFLGAWLWIFQWPKFLVPPQFRDS